MPGHEKAASSVIKCDCAESSGCREPVAWVLVHLDRELGEFKPIESGLQYFCDLHIQPYWHVPSEVLRIVTVAEYEEACAAARVRRCLERRGQPDWLTDAERDADANLEEFGRALATHVPKLR